MDIFGVLQTDQKPSQLVFGGCRLHCQVGDKKKRWSTSTQTLENGVFSNEDNFLKYEINIRIL